jgi:hypothetical protein
MVAGDGVEPPTPAFSELVFPVFPITSMVAIGLPRKVRARQTDVGEYGG